jgi:hypothetical protein
MAVERPDTLGDYPVEATNLINHRIGHSLTLVSKLREVHLLINAGARPADVDLQRPSERSVALGDRRSADGTVDRLALSTFPDRKR